MFQFYFKEKLNVLRMFRLLVSSRYRRVRKMQLHLVLFALFIYTIFKEDIHQSFVSTAPTYKGGANLHPDANLHAGVFS